MVTELVQVHMRLMNAVILTSVSYRYHNLFPLLRGRAGLQYTYNGLQGAEIL